MRRILLCSVILMMLLACAALAQSQSEQPLGDVARENRAAQQTQETSRNLPKVITNDRLPDALTEDQSAPADTMTTVSGVKRSNRAADQRLSARLQAEQRARAQWRSRIEQQENRVADLQSRIDRINASIQSVVGTAQYETPVNRFEAVQLQRLAALKENLDEQKRTLDSLQEQARRAGMNQ